MKKIYTAMSLSDWNNRADRFIEYKGEVFYTITPLPYYIKRRDTIVNLLKKKISNTTDVCDFGCGDGWYIKQLHDAAPDTKFYGIDKSDNMLQRSKSTVPQATFYNSLSEIDEKIEFELIYAVAVFAHLDDIKTKEIFIQLHERLKPGGILILIEQVAPFNYKGETFVRRTNTEYRKMILQTGFSNTENLLIDFKVHRYFERYISKIFYKWIYGKKKVLDQRIHANQNIVFRFLSKMALFFDRKYLVQNQKEGWGYTYLVSTKRELQ